MSQLSAAKKGLLAAAFTLFGAACSDSPVSTEHDSAPDLSASVGAGTHPVPDHYIVVLKNTVSDVPRTAQRIVASRNGRLEHIYESAIKGFAAEMSASDAALVARDPDVDFVEADQIYHTTVTQSPATWGIDRIDQRNLPLSNSYTYTATGSGVNVYIIDTGIRITHTQFATGRAVGAFTSINDGNGTNDCNGHGTHVSGTVAGTTYGVAKAAKVYAVRVLNCAGSGSTSGVIAGVNYVSQNHIKPAVANMSLGGGPSAALDQSVTNAINAGVTFAIAAGNSNANACNFSPARTPLAITVAATTRTDARASFSNFGTCVDIFAPGQGITSAWNSSNTAINTISGTSMSAPHVAGAAALYLQGAPTATPATVTTALVSNATNGVVTNPGSGSPNKLLYTGFIGGGQNQPPVARFIFRCIGLTCIFSANTSTDDVAIISYNWDFGDGTSSPNKEERHTYAAPGTYNVTLTVTDGGGLSNSTTKAVTVQ